MESSNEKENTHMDAVINRTNHQKTGFYMNLATGLGLLLVGAFIAYGQVRRLARKREKV